MSPTGLPNIRAKIPSRNWLIFLSITGTWTAAVVYDRRQKKQIQKKWAKVVEHIAAEPMDVSMLPRKLTVYISAPPGDGLLPAREHFNEYVKPILVAAALDWDAVEGRREGDVRAGLASRIRRLRKKSGEPSVEPVEDDNIQYLEEARARSGVRNWDGIPGDIVIGRHTWKEYVRGLHEGWLGPLDPPATPEEPAAVPVAAPAAEPVATSTSIPESLPMTSTATAPNDDASPAAVPELEKPKEEESKPKKKTQPPPFNTTADYNDSQLSPNCPKALGPTAVVPLPHLLGFLNFPIRMYRFLNRRQAADEIGRDTVAAVLAAYRPFDAPGESRVEPDAVSSDSGEDGSAQYEQQRLLQHEEPDWHDTVRERKEDDTRERVWLDEMVLDPRIAERMRKFVLEPEVDERAKAIASQPSDKAWFESLWPKKQEKKNWEGLTEE